jgi:threonine synthase
VFACASTGNLANSVSAHAARLGLECYVFIPDNLEPAKVLGSAIYRPHVVAVAGNYDDVNRLCTQIADSHKWGFANINLRTYYAEGAKTYGFEIAEQLGWRFPRHVVCPVAGGTLLPRIARAFEELRMLGWIDADLPRMHAVQAAGSSPVINALDEGLEFPDPVKPQTVAKSIAIGNPADGYHVLEAVRATRGAGARVTDEQILSAAQLLAEMEGVFTEPAGGATLAGAMQLIEAGTIPPDEPIVVCITGNGYKTADVMAGRIAEPARIGRSYAEFESYFASVSGVNVGT